MAASGQDSAGGGKLPAAAEIKADERSKKTGPAIRYPFWFGGSASSMAACVTHPLDLGTSNAHPR